MSSPVPRLARVAGEFAIVCAGVLAALVADDWREGRVERDMADRALMAMVVDLDADSAVLTVLADTWAAKDHAIARLLAHAGDPSFPQDSVEACLDLVYRGAPYAPSRAGFSLAVSTGALQHVRDDSLRVALVKYFDQTDAMFNMWFREAVEGAVALTSRLRPHFRPRLSPEVASLFPVPWEARELQTSWNQLRSDNDLMHQLFDVGAYAGEFANDSRSRLQENRALREQIRLELGTIR